jgi:hypothetical protein
MSDIFQLPLCSVHIENYTGKTIKKFDPYYNIKSCSSMKIVHKILIMNHGIFSFFIMNEQCLSLPYILKLSFSFYESSKS